ncbi:GAF domain-containing sensor histidine kinase [Thermaerobacillus caldiproteolyticus]|uniref:histidine kinase n=1 Tax=Thermaerobacillus caldiproteolyticus TaxID=247480 RepID=A0A7V9Z616_9BACL|nr:GAF domain-containing sensor histidine kinase [Anoxybacillus caldiproteolyticus]MBA2874724.1 two-component system NarL family sensor kinase [Anoxybacillus caldiproteolyticus]QPA31493.1 GAF domain-containing sensor histidine kinase [Anoxybacillus caldiproteolyticus]
MEREKQRIQELQTLKLIAETLNEANDLEEMLQAVLKQLMQVMKLQCGWVFFVNEKGDFSLVADYELPPALTWGNKKPMCEGDCWCLDRCKDGRLQRAANVIECKRLEDAIEEKWGDTNGITHHASIPLRAGEEKFGLLNVAAPHKTHFTSEELALLEAVAYQIGTAIKRIKLVENEQKLALLAERNRLARDLHDSVNQLLFSLLLTARGAKEMTEDENMKDTFTYIQQLAQEALHEMRALIWQLRPQGLENGLASALKHYGNMLGLKIDIDIQGVIDLPNEVEECLWRVGQEALNNCKKHAGISTVYIVISVQSNKVKMSVHDQGCGFHYIGENTLSLGLSSMRERVTSLNGEIHIKSTIGEGTTIQVMIPLKRGRG